MALMLQTLYRASVEMNKENFMREGKTSRLVSGLIMGLVLTISTLVHAGDDGANGSGGDNPTRVNEALIEHYLLDGVLKQGLMNYLSAIKFNRVQDVKIKKLLLDKRLRPDILSANNYVIRDQCDSETDKNSLSSTKFGNLKGPICFNVKGLAVVYANRGLSAEMVLVELATIAIHEHAHHLQQNNPQDKNVANEKIADRLGAYFLSSARNAQSPTLEWYDSSANLGPRVLECNYFDPGGFDMETITAHLDDKDQVVAVEYMGYQGSIGPFVENVAGSKRGFFEYTSDDLIVNLIITVSVENKIAHLSVVYKNTGSSDTSSFFNCK